MNNFFLAILFVVLTEGCTSPLSKFKCVYDMYGDSTVYYEIIINGNYLRTTKYKHILLSGFDNLKKTWHTPIDSLFEKKDSVFLNRELQDSLIFHIENAIKDEEGITSYMSTNTSKITMTWNKRTYELQYHNMKQRGLISFLKKHSPIHIK
jgi:hypothetical protein